MKRDRIYVIAPNTPAVRTWVQNAIASGEIIESALSTIRLSNDGQWGIIKFNFCRLKKVPDRLREYAQNNGVRLLSHAQILALLATDPNWSSP